MQSNTSRSLSFCQAGFSLVEILVGLAIGMFATLVIMQVMSVFEVQRRTTSGSADAQTNGSIALYTIGRELQLAGYPLIPATNSPLECTALTINGVADATTPNRLSPVAITNGVSDTIVLRYGNSPMGGVPVQIGGVAGGVVTVDSGFGCSVNDITLVINGAACAMSSATSAAATTVTLADATAAAANASSLACLGTWNEVTYAVNNGNLQRAGVDSVAGIVNLQAQYGISTAANSNQVTLWVDASGGTWAAPTVANRNRIKAVRIAVVARNAKMEPENVTTACSSTTAAAPTGLCAWEGSGASPAPTIDLSADPNWRRYRYRVFETILPLRNVIWASGTL